MATHDRLPRHIPVVGRLLAAEGGGLSPLPGRLGGAYEVTGSMQPIGNLGQKDMQKGPALSLGGNAAGPR